MADWTPETPATPPIHPQLSPSPIALVFETTATCFGPATTGLHGVPDDIQHVQTGTYGLATTRSGSLNHMGLIGGNGPEEGLQQPNSLITSLPTAGVRYSVSHGGTEWMASTFAGSDGSTNNPSDLVDMGRFMQLIEIRR